MEGLGGGGIPRKYDDGVEGLGGVVWGDDFDVDDDDPVVLA